MLDKSTNDHGKRREAGFSMIEVMLVATMIGVLSCYAGLRIAWAQDNLRLTNSAQILSGYVEKSRLAAIRCHCTSSLQIINNANYTVTGYLRGPSLETLSIPLESNIVFTSNQQTITFDWRGRTNNNYPIIIRNSRRSVTVNVAGGGDVTINSNADYSFKPNIEAALPTDLTDLAADSYVTSSNTSGGSTPSSTPPPNPKNHKKPKK
jgi:prepilin-type N-terminal cleavage/methylation domain-containing protein